MIPADELGPTLMHEHIIVAAPEMVSDYPGLIGFDENAVVARAIDDLESCYESGFRTIVDLTVPGLGRQARLVARVARQTRLNVVMATGFYALSNLPPSLQIQGPGRFVDMPDPLVAMFLHDINEGIAGTGIKAAILKCVTDRAGLTRDVLRILHAVASAHLQTGTPIATHSSAEKHTGLDQQRVLSEAGVELTRVVIGHCGDTGDLDYLRQIIDNGSYVGMDRFGLDDFRTTARRVDTVAALCAEGLAERLVLSHDACSFHDGITDSWRDRHAPHWNHAYLGTSVLPALRRRGVSEDDIQTMVVTNPRRILCGERAS